MYDLAENELFASYKNIYIEDDTVFATDNDDNTIDLFNLNVPDISILKGIELQINCDKFIDIDAYIDIDPIMMYMVFDYCTDKMTFSTLDDLRRKGIIPKISLSDI